MKGKVAGYFRNVKHLKISKHLKIVLITLMLVSLGVSAFYLYSTFRNPLVIEEKITDYSYTQKADVNYRVYFNPNPIYNETSLGKGYYYLSPFIKNINTFFTYQFTGDMPVEFKGEYDVKAYLNGILREREEIKTIWSREYELLPATPFSGKDKVLTLEKELPIDYRGFTRFVEKFIEDTKINNEVILIVKWSVKIEAQTGNGPVKEELTPTLIIPMNKSFFQMSGEPTIEKNGAIERTVKKELPVNKRKVYALGGGVGVALIAMVYLIFLTKVPVIDAQEKSRKEIFKKHGDRLVALGDEVIIDSVGMMQVKTMDDLVLIADEISRPIMYKEDTDREKKISFYVIDQPQVFRYELKIPISETLEQSNVLEKSKKVEL